MSADGDIVRGAGLTSDELAALARLEAAEAELDEYSTDIGYSVGYEDGKRYAEAQRDALAEALQKIVAYGVEPPTRPEAEIARAALAEAGLEP